MEKKRFQKISVAALLVSVLPLTTFIPILLKLSLSEGVRTIWAGANILFIIAAFILSVICIKSRGSRNIVNVISMIISSLWLLLMVGMVALVLFLNFI